MEARRGHPQRDRPGRALQGQPGHGAQGDRRARHRNLLVRRQGNGHLRRHARRADNSTASCACTPDDGVRTGTSAACSTAGACARRRRGACSACASATGGPLARRVLRPRRSCSTIWLPGPACSSGLTAEKLSATAGRCTVLFESEFGVRMIRAEERSARSADGRGRAARGDRRAPLLWSNALALTYGDKPVELRRGLCEHATPTTTATNWS